MNVDERMILYIRSLNPELPDWLSDLEQEAKNEHIPIIRKETQSLLRVLLCMKKPQRLLEIGAGVGFSSIFMSEYAGKDCRITTMENYPPRIQKVKENLQATGKQDQITLLEGDARERIKKLSPSFDFIFLDAAKGQYLHFLPEIKRLLAVGGVLVSDNVLQEGDIIESRYAVRRRDRTIHERMREYLWEISHSEGLETTVLPIADGISVSVRK